MIRKKNGKTHLFDDSFKVELLYHNYMFQKIHSIMSYETNHRVKNDGGYKENPKLRIDIICI